MESIKVLDKVFVPMISAEEIANEVRRVAKEINRDYEGRNPIFLAILNGSFMFAADLLREVDIPCEITFVKMASYEGTSSTGEVREIIGLNRSIEGRDVIIVEDIVDTGITMAHMIETLQGHNPKSLEICTFFLKPESLKVELNIRYTAMGIPNDFILGYGLDYDGYGRNLRDVWVLKG